MKYALNNKDLYKARERYMCAECVFATNNMIRCQSINLCDNGSILKRSRYQSDIFKI